MYDILFRNSLLREMLFQPLRSNSMNIPADVYMDDNGLTIQIAIPRGNKEDVSVSLNGDKLHILYTKKKSEQNNDRYYLCKKISNRSFEFDIKLNQKINGEKIGAAFENGLLKVTVPYKGEEITKKQIPININ